MKRLFILLCLSLYAWPVLAQEELRVGVELQPYQPYSDVQNGEYRGYARDLLDAFAEEYGYHFVYTPLPVRRLLSDFLSGRVDLKFPDHPQWNANQKAGHDIHYSQPAAPYIDGILLKPNYLGLGKGHIRLLGTQNGFTPWPYLADVRSGRIRLIQANQIDSLLRMAVSDRVDAVYLNPQVVAHQLRKMRLPADILVFDPELDHVRDHYYLSSINHPQVIAAFDRFLQERAELVAALRLRHGL
ncbi:transporter substrate-binding domain-containing protein [Pseudomonas berkeleyensis]|uniref:Transporter substrate-binding domain-containing protein n=1 Tax=Pseudomonas berkeleyensis TaxID=2726956 RepID=A0A7G5DNP8_9PSED|nr:transporter substrate-binding domain-containing protein [Pseudomonas berkeleyensis]QMV63373.1 transporter substrate-binding domain-containing protein [Pseudomonas berkeleyensis]WSO38834.1 transporter substrate-binding domain-containing protein [Pseudomonas berkeleyensis]